MKYIPSNRRRGAAALLALVTAGALALSGCGTATNTANTQWIGTADAICRQLNSKLLSTPPATHASHVAIGLNALQHAALERKSLAELSRLTVPASLASSWAQILTYRRKLAAELVTLAGYWKLDDVKSLRALASSKAELHAKLAELAGRDGFNDCAFVGSAAA
jgi:hypothetical protein